MFQNFGASGPGGGIQRQHFPEQRPLVSAERRVLEPDQLEAESPELGQGRVVLGKDVLALRVVQLPGARELEDLVQTLHLVFGREQDFPAKHFPEDAAQAPHVDFDPVVARAEQDLGGQVRHGAWGYASRISYLFCSKSFGRGR